MLPPRPSPTQVLLADDHPALRLGLKQAVNDCAQFEVTAEAADGLEAYELVKEKRPHIALLDWDMPKMNGLQVLQRIRAENLTTRVAILTMHNEESMVNAAVKAGVNGFVLKDHAIEEILLCLERIQEGKFYLTPVVAPHVERKIEIISQLNNEHPGFSKLTKKQHEILSLVSRGFTSKEIATQLNLSPRTVETHRYNICEKLGLKGSHALTPFIHKFRTVLEE